MISLLFPNNKNCAYVVYLRSGKGAIDFVTTFARCSSSTVIWQWIADNYIA